VHFLDSWTELAAFDLVRLLAPAVLLVITIFLPGRHVARPAALGVAVAVVFLPELGSPWLMGGWALVWIAIGVLVGRVAPGATDSPVNRAGGAESLVIGLLIGLALLALLTAGVARQDLSPEDGRRASWGLLLLGLGLLHLMLRRHALRALMAFGALGLGLQMLEGAARGTQIPSELAPAWVILVGTIGAVALVARVARGRERVAGSAWVGDAHDLHD
jgi:hypothetical protein